MEKHDGRRGFLKYLVSFLAFGITSIFSFRVNKEEGFKIGRRMEPFAPPEASGACGIGRGCAGGGGQCGLGSGCAGGGGQCGLGSGCAGGGGQCGIGSGCAGS